MVSTRNLHLLPAIEPLRRLCQSVAVLDAILSPDPEFRYYQFQSQWGEGRALATMRDELGDGWHILFAPAGAALKGFVPDSLMATPFNARGEPWPGVLDDLPEPFSELVTDSRLGGRRATFCAWRTTSDDAWRRGLVRFPVGRDPDGSEHLLSPLDGEPVSYARWAEQYYETEIPFIDVRRVFMHRPMTEEIAKSLNPGAKWEPLLTDLLAIGYPVKS